jgi:hypothetical protein
LKLELKAEYFLINDYLYFAASNGGVDAAPQQYGTAINMIKLSVSKNLTWHKFHFDNYVVYQKSDNLTLLRTPEVYVYSYVFCFFFLAAGNKHVVQYQPVYPGELGCSFRSVGGSPTACW